MKFAVIGVGGYIAPRHLKAISDTGNTLSAAYDPKDSVGILDRYFFDVEYFTNFEEFHEYIKVNPVDYVSICTPNYLHKSHIAFALRNGANAICEKPLVLTGADLDELARIEKETGKRLYTVLQLRVHDVVQKIRAEILAKEQKEKHEVELVYFTSRGPWFHRAWKGNEKLSGGLASNIGVHFFDMLTWTFGEEISCEVHVKNDHIVAGYLELEKARVKWMLSVDRKYIPKEYLAKGKTTYRSIRIDGKEVEFSEGFTELHTVVYQDILAGRGYGLEDARAAVEITERIRKMNPSGTNRNTHPLLQTMDI